MNIMEEDTVHIIGLCGSLRQNSFNKRLLERALYHAQQRGAQCTLCNATLLELPPFNEDNARSASPPPVLELKNLIASADLLIITTPEYNHSIPGVLKNMIDWDSYNGNPFDGKVAVIMGASPGKLGTVRAQLHLRQILTALGVYVIEKPQLFVSEAHSAFSKDGSLVDQNSETMLIQLVERGLHSARVRHLK